MRRHHPRGRGPAEWGRTKLLMLLVAGAVTGAVLLVGVGLSVYFTVAPDSSPQPERPSRLRTGNSFDALAARPMPAAGVDAARPGPLSTTPMALLRLPVGRRLGPADVTTGFPASPEGALAQLVALDQAALQSASVPGAQAVIRGWTRPGGPTPRSWSGVRAVAGLLSAARLPASGSPRLTVEASPELGLIKGVIGDRFAVACVDFVVTATGTTTASTAAADCQRMVWTPAARGAGPADTGAGRWLIGPGSEPAQPPSVWPGTDRARRAGYLRLTFEG